RSSRTCGSTPTCCSPPAASTRTTSRRSSGAGSADALAELALDEVEDLAEQSLDPLVGQGSSVRLAQPGEQSFLLAGIEERQPIRLLVAADFAHELEPRVDEVEDLAVGLRHAAAQRLERRIGHSLDSRPAGYDPKTCSRSVRSRISRSTWRTSRSSGWPASTASKRYRHRVFGIGRATT